MPRTAPSRRTVVRNRQSRDKPSPSISNKPNRGSSTKPNKNNIPKENTNLFKTQTQKTSSKSYGNMTSKGWQPNTNVNTDALTTSRLNKQSGGSFDGKGITGSFDGNKPTFKKFGESLKKELGLKEQAKPNKNINDPSNMNIIEFAKDTLNPKSLAETPGAVGIMMGGISPAGQVKNSKKLTNDIWKSIVNKQPAVGTISTKTGIVQTNAKTKGIIKNIFNWLTTSKETITYTDGKGAIKTTSMIKTSATKPLIAVGATVAAIAGIAQLSLGGKNFKNFLGTEEAAQAAGMATWIAASADNYEAYWEARALQDEALNPEKLNESIGMIPYANTKKGIEDYAETARRAGKIMDDVMRDKQMAEENGMDKFELAEQRKLSQELFLMDAQDQINRQFLELKKEANIEESRRIEKEMAKQRELERQEAEWMAQYWLDYKKAVIALENSSKESYTPSKTKYEPPSALNFGLI